jgi:predicted nucleotide-binding protein
MSELHEELLEIAEKLEVQSLKAEDSTFKEPLDLLENAANTLGKAWSGSWLGYQASVYYNDLQTPPPGAHFSQEWGLMDRFGIQGTTGDWREFRTEDLEKGIHKIAGNPDLEILRKLSEEVAHVFEGLKADMLSVLTTALSEAIDPFLVNLKEQTEKTKLLTQRDVAQGLKPTGQLMSRDSLAVTQSLQVPAHIAVIAEVIELRHPPKACEKLSKIARQAGSHLVRKQRKSKKTEVVGTNVFIGHGQSQMWKDLKDFIQDRLKLPWDEFNRVPVAGVTNIARLSEMLDAAAIAFLVLTGEDEQPDGKLHARMNVVHEAGLFQGRLGFTRAIVILEEDCEEFSNIQGLGQIRFPRGNIKAIFEEIRHVLERENLIGSRS